MRLIPPHMDRLVRYETGVLPPDAEHVLKLNQNESPYPPSPRVREVLSRLEWNRLRLYPDGECRRLRDALADRYGVQACQVMAGNGSSELISLIMKVLIGPGRTVALPDPTFELYHTSAAVHQARTVRVPLDREYGADVDGLLASGADAAVLVNPHAPTGRLLGKEEVRRLVSSFQGLVVVDEAYMEFADPDVSAAPLIREYGNLIVLRTFSKAYGLSGARVGCCLADAALIGALDKGRDIYNVNAVSGDLALAALKDPSYTQKTVRLVRSTRETFSGRLAALGFRVVPSSANFVLCMPPERPDGAIDAAAWYARLMERGVYVRYFAGHPLLRDKLRISIGTDADMDRLIRIMEDIRITPS